jgi:type II secretory ATPase GspE/PulE/Tfp pilus assembly ATPase PilB-like protein
VFELLAMDQGLRKLLTRASEGEIMEAARRGGLTTLREQAVQLVREGTTSFDEITRVFHDL